MKTIKLNTMENKITKEELSNLSELNLRLNQLVSEIGVLEAKKHGALHGLSDVNQQLEEFKAVLQKSYGRISINLEDGSYTKEQEEENVDTKD